MRGLPEKIKVSDVEYLPYHSININSDLIILYYKSMICQYCSNVTIW